MILSDSLIIHPFFLSTTLVANASWFIAFVSQAIAAAKSNHSVVATLWLAILLQLIVNLGMIYSLMSNSIPCFRLQIIVFAAMSVVLGALGIERNIFSGIGSRDALAAAWIFLLIVDILWIIVVSSDRNSPVLQVFGEEARIRLSSDLHSPICDQDELRIHTSTSDIPTVEKDKQLLDPRRSPISPTSGSDDTARPSTSNSPILKPPSSSSKFSISSERQTLLTVPKTSATRTSSEPSSNYSYSQKAYALYDYSGSDSAVDELSFVKGDILEVSRTEDRKWWPARKPNGQSGVVPSNYLMIIQG